MVKKQSGIDISDDDIADAKELVNIVKSDEAYLKSGRWKCSTSPTGAHQWFVEELGQRRRVRFNKQVCRCCGEIRKFCLLVE